MGPLNKFPLKGRRGRIPLLDWSRIFYVQADADDSLVRTARKKLYRHIEPLEKVEERLPSPPFFRCHRSFIVNLERVLELRIESDGDYTLKLEPPVNALIPLSRRRYTQLKRLLKI